MENGTQRRIKMASDCPYRCSGMFQSRVIESTLRNMLILAGLKGRYRFYILFTFRIGKGIIRWIKGTIVMSKR